MARLNLPRFGEDRVYTDLCGHPYDPQLAALLPEKIARQTEDITDKWNEARLAGRRQERRDESIFQAVCAAGGAAILSPFIYWLTLRDQPLPAGWFLWGLTAIFTTLGVAVLYGGAAGLLWYGVKSAWHSFADSFLGRDYTVSVKEVHFQNLPQLSKSILHLLRVSDTKAALQILAALKRLRDEADQADLQLADLRGRLASITNLHDLAFPADMKRAAESGDPSVRKAEQAVYDSAQNMLRQRRRIEQLIAQLEASKRLQHNQQLELVTSALNATTSSRLPGELADEVQTLIKEINEDIASNDAAVNEVLQLADPALTHAVIETESPLLRLHDEWLGFTAHLREHLCRISPENRSFLVYRQGPDKGEKGLMNVDLASLAESELIEIALRPESRLPFCEEDRAAIEGIRLFRQRDDQSGESESLARAYLTLLQNLRRKLADAAVES